MFLFSLNINVRDDIRSTSILPNNTQTTFLKTTKVWAWSRPLVKFLVYSKVIKAVPIDAPIRCSMFRIGEESGI